MEVGEQRIIRSHLLDIEYLPRSIDELGGTATLWDLIDMYEDEAYNRDAVQDLLRKAGQNQTTTR